MPPLKTTIFGLVGFGVLIVVGLITIVLVSSKKCEARLKNYPTADVKSKTENVLKFLQTKDSYVAYSEETPAICGSSGNEVTTELKGYSSYHVYGTSKPRQEIESYIKKQLDNGWVEDTTFKGSVVDVIRYTKNVDNIDLLVEFYWNDLSPLTQRNVSFEEHKNGQYKEELTAINPKLLETKNVYSISIFHTHTN